MLCASVVVQVGHDVLTLVWISEERAAEGCLSCTNSYAAYSHRTGGFINLMLGYSLPALPMPFSSH
jgi:hypothetical protein